MHKIVTQVPGFDQSEKEHWLLPKRKQAHLWILFIFKALLFRYSYAKRQVHHFLQLHQLMKFISGSLLLLGLSIIYASNSLLACSVSSQCCKMKP